MKTYKLIIIAVCALALTACSSIPTVQTKSPTQTLKDFVEASKKKDVAEMKKMLSKGSIELIQKTADMQKTTVDEILKKDDESSMKQTPETGEEKVEGDKATVESKNPATGEYDKIPFVKEEGTWKIALDTLMNDMMQKLTEQMKKPAVNMPDSNTNSPSANNNSANKQ
jgi:inorganic pyrophosphatase/exopolyphosphatase